MTSASELAAYFGGLEAHLHLALRGEVVDLVRLRLLNDADQVGGVGQVPVVHQVPDVSLVGICVEVVDAIGVEEAGPAFDTVHGVALGEQRFGQVGVVLAGDSVTSAVLVIVPSFRASTDARGGALETGGAVGVVAATRRQRQSQFTERAVEARCLQPIYMVLLPRGTGPELRGRCV